jgi:hypothetical protein
LQILQTRHLLLRRVERNGEGVNIHIGSSYRISHPA